MDSDHFYLLYTTERKQLTIKVKDTMYNRTLDGVNKVQRYKITLVREVNGSWNVGGFWEIQTEINTHHGRDRMYSWDQDGAWKTFDTREQAVEFIKKQQGVPE